MQGLAAELRRHLALHQEQLAQYLAFEERDYPAERAADVPAEDRLRHLLLRGGIDSERFWIGWITEVLAEVEGMPEG